MASWNFPIGHPGMWQNTAATAGTPTAFSITPGSTAYATPVQVTASAPFDVGHILVRTVTSIGVAGSRKDTLLKVMVGGAGSETNVVGPVLFGGRNAHALVSVPVFIPAGSRISVTMKGTGPVANTFNVLLYRAHPLGVYPTRWVPYGITDDTSNSIGTNIVSGNTNTWGSWTVITTSTTYPHKLWLPMVGGGTQTTMTNLNYRLRFAGANTTDAATAATNGTTWDDVLLNTSTSEILSNTDAQATGLGGLVHPPWPFFQPLPAGSAISAQGMCSGTANTNAINVAVLGAIF